VSCTCRWCACRVCSAKCTEDCTGPAHRYDPGAPGDPNANGGDTTPPPPAPLTEPSITYFDRDDEDDDVFWATSLPRRSA
jgi:hypothetical protein